jgi:zinc protease
MKQKSLALLTALLLLFCMISCKKSQTGYSVPVDYFKLDNGLKVVLSKDNTAPVVTVAVYYNIGFRIEPKDRTGFAHLFEHMMFQGSVNAPKGQFDKLISYNGGVNNGSTRFDFTNYFEVMPAHMLEPTLWIEADRMSGLDLTQENLVNQQGVVVNEINGALHNQPYGGFPWLDMPQYANSNWYNSHNFYGDVEDVKAANLEDVKNFFKTYYAPNNACLVVVGDIDPVVTKELIIKYFSKIPSVNRPAMPDLAEPVQEKEKKFSKEDALATQPALAFAYHMPDKNTPEYYAMGLLDQILLKGEDSRLYQSLVKEKGLTGSIDGGINGLLGNMFNYNGPMLWSASLFYDNNISSDTIMLAVDKVIENVRNNPVEKQVLDRAIVKLRSDFYNISDEFFGAGRADFLACFALFNDNPSMINSIEDSFKAVTPELILKTAEKYLRPENRTILTIIPKAK